MSLQRMAPGVWMRQTLSPGRIVVAEDDERRPRTKLLFYAYKIGTPHAWRQQIATYIMIRQL